MICTVQYLLLEVHTHVKHTGKPVKNKSSQVCWNSIILHFSEMRQDITIHTDLAFMSKFHVTAIFILICRGV